MIKVNPAGLAATLAQMSNLDRWEYNARTGTDAPVYYGLAAERAAEIGYEDGDLFIETDTAGIYQRAQGEWIDMQTTDAETLQGHGADDFALLAGLAGGQSLAGGTAAGDTLTLIGSAHADAGPIHLGDDTNYIEIAADGHLSLHGAAMAWDDLRIEPTARATGTNAPTFEKWRDSGAGSRGVYLYSFDNASAGSEKEIFFSVQLPHAWAQTPIYIHVHWIAESTAETSRVRWGLEYAWAEPGAVFPVTQTIYAAIPVDASTGTTQYEHEITPFAALTPSASQDGLSAILICRLYRNSSHADDTYTGKAGLLYVDAHVQTKSLGSNDEYA